MTEVICKNCGKIFYYYITHQNYPGGKDREPIDCPYCNVENGSVITSGIIEIKKGQAK